MTGTTLQALFKKRHGQGGKSAASFYGELTMGTMADAISYDANFSQPCLQQPFTMGIIAPCGYDKAGHQLSGFVPIGKKERGFTSLICTMESRAFKKYDTQFSSNSCTTLTSEANSRDEGDASGISNKKCGRRSRYDLLTYLPTSYRMSELFKRAALLAEHEKSLLHLIYITFEFPKHLSSLKDNEIDGELLTFAANRLKGCFNGNDILGRHARNEFIALTFKKDEEGMIQKLQMICSESKKSFAAQENVFHLSTWIGMSLFPRDGRDFETLLKKASASCRCVATIEYNTDRFISANIRTDERSRGHFQAEFHDSIKDRQFILHHQR